VEAANADLDVSIENYDDALVLLISEVASAYVQIRVFQQRLKYADVNVAIQTVLVKQAEGRLKGGVGRQIDQAQMRSNLTNTLAAEGTAGDWLASGQQPIVRLARHARA